MTMIQGNSASPATQALAVVPGSNPLALAGIRGLHIGVGGTVRVKMAQRENDSDFVDFVAATGCILPIAVTHVIGGGATTATSIVALA